MNSPSTGPAADTWMLAGREYHSRLLLGTGGMTSMDIMEDALVASGAQIATVALRRYQPSQAASLFSMLSRLGVDVLPNTAGCHTSRDAVLTAKLAR